MYIPGQSLDHYYIDDENSTATITLTTVDITDPESNITLQGIL